MSVREKEKEKDREITFEVEEHIGIIGTSPTGWKKEINMVAWNGNPAKFDIREWDEDHSHMSRGITMNKDEVKALTGILSELQLQ
ncbi:MAG TPA: PC4/YdbC family ssDNA-binding protein [Anaerovoracaceae bacterium]|nr:PC4/YdbC family ssDNA-binding protein [Anaerovoracaceae bacterium]